MSTIQIGSIVKIKAEAFKEGAALDDLSGAFGHPQILKGFTFKVTKLSSSSRGEVAYATVHSSDPAKSLIPNCKEIKTRGEIVLLLSELVLAVDKITLSYKLIDETSDSLERLFEKRTAMKAQGLGKMNPAMMANWRLIQMLRGERKNDGSVDTTVNVKIKNGISLSVDKKQLPIEGDAESSKKFQHFLVNEIQKIRSSRKVIKHDEPSKKAKEVLGGEVPTKIGGVYQKSNSLYERYCVMLETAFDEAKSPTDAKANYVGIEIEFIYSGNEKLLKNLLIKKGLHKNVELKEDGSLRACYGDGSYGTKELTILCKDTEVEDVMSRLQSVLNDPKIDAYANRSCGVHVHLDMRNRNVDLSYKNLVRVQNILRGAQPAGRAKSKYCKPNTSDDFKTMKKVSSGARYWVVNPDSYERHNTIEIRIHEGSTDCQGLLSWIQFLNVIASLTIELPEGEYSKASQLVTSTGISIPAHSVQYLDSRIERFNSLAI